MIEYVKSNDQKIINATVELPELPKGHVISDFLIKKAIFEFNEKYAPILSEDEISVLKSVINENNNSQETTFSVIKEGTLNSLKKLKTEIESENKSNIDVNEQREVGQYASKINESIKNIEALVYKKDSFMSDIVDLINLKKELST